MKKIFVLATIIAALALVTVSCSKDKDPEEVSKNITGTDWAGYLTEERKDMGNWVDNNQRNFAVIRFIGTSTSANAIPTGGTGYQVEFSNSYMNEKTGYSNFRWRLNDGHLEMTYETKGWDDTYIDYNDATVTATTLNGYMYDYSGHRFRMELTANGSFDWSKWKE